jgi:hypothetical protein
MKLPKISLGLSRGRAILLVSATALSPISCAQTPELTQQATPQQHPENDAHKDGCVPSLPYARGKIFCGLDEYLAYLQVQGAIDLPWWKEIRPGVYERVSSMRPAPEREIATRDELMRRFGFIR